MKIQSFVAAIALVMSLATNYVFASTPTADELSALTTLPKGYIVYCKSWNRSNGIKKVVLGKTTATDISSDGGWPIINFWNPNIIAYAVNVNGALTGDAPNDADYKIMLMDSSGHNKREICSTTMRHVLGLYWATGSKLMILADPNPSSWQVSHLFCLDTATKATTEINLSGSNNFDAIAATKDRFIIHITGGNHQGASVYSWDANSPSTAPVFLGSQSTCGSAITIDDSLTACNYADHQGLYVGNGVTGSFGPMDHGDLSPASPQDLYPMLPWAGYNLNDYRWSNDNNWGVIRTREVTYFSGNWGEEYVYVVDVRNKKLVRQSFVTTVNTDGCQFPAIYVDKGPDLDPPTLGTLSTPDQTTVVVPFSEPVTAVSAQNIANYSISNGITISAASLGTDTRTVTLTIAQITKDVTYTLTVSGIRDRAPASNVIAAGSTGTFKYTDLITKLRFFPRTGFPERMTGGVFEGTTGDQATGPYVTIYTIATQPTPGWTEITTFANPDPGFRYIRYRSPTNSSCNVAEIELYKGSTKAIGQVFGTTGSWNNTGNDYTKVFDGSTTTFMDYVNPSGGYVGLDLQTTIITNSFHAAGLLKSVHSQATSFNIYDCSGRLIKSIHGVDMSKLETILKKQFGTGSYIVSTRAKGLDQRNFQIVVQ